MEQMSIKKREGGREGCLRPLDYTDYEKITPIRNGLKINENLCNHVFNPCNPLLKSV